MKRNFVKIMTGALISGVLFGSVTTFGLGNAYAGGLEGNFPDAYKTKLEALNRTYPNWTFKAVETGIKWDDVIAAESTGNKNLTSKSYSKYMLSRASGDYNASTGSYVAKDGSTWVSASRAAIAYYMDPRNFLTSDYMFMFEAQDFNQTFHTVEGVRAILSGTDLASNNPIKYLDTSGNTRTINTTYVQAIYDAGKAAGVSPLALASRIKQETGGSLSNGSISGNYSYTSGKTTVNIKGYYNFYNIGATSTGSGTAVSRGLDYAKSKGWTDPVTAIKGGVSFLATSYINKGQNTGYFQKFNVVYKPYYAHQYMQNLTAAATEGNSTLTAYNKLGIVSKSYAFYIPVYSNMPSLTSKVNISKSVKTGTITNVTTNVNMRNKPSTNGSVVASVPKNATVTLDGAVYTDATSVYTQLANPYWFKVTYNGSTGYISGEYINVNTESKILVGSTKQLSTTTGSGEKIYYETTNPAVATVDTAGKITAVGPGECDIYAVSSSAQTLDAIGVETYAQLSKPTLGAMSNASNGLTVTWTKVTGATGYYVYRKVAGTDWSLVGTVNNGATLNFTDKSAVAGTTYTYTVKAYNSYVTSDCDATGKTYMRIVTPTISSVTTNLTTATLKWNKVAGATGYYVYRRKNSLDWKLTQTITGADNIQAVEKNLLSGTQYSYSVVAFNSSYSSYRDTTGKVCYTIPDKVAMKAVSNVDGGVNVTWTPIVRGTGYKVYRKLTTDAKWSLIATVKGISNASYKDTKASSGKKYAYTVRAYKISVNGAYDTVGKTILYLSRPTLKSTSTTKNSVKVTWTKVTGAKGYYVYRKVSGKWKKIATIKSGGTVSYTNKSLSANTSYVYTVRAYNGSIMSGYISKGITGKTKAVYKTYRTVTKVNYRSGAGTSYKKAGSLAKNKKISVEHGYSKKANGYTWLRFKLNNKNYYIASKYVK